MVVYGTVLKQSVPWNLWLYSNDFTITFISFVIHVIDIISYNNVHFCVSESCDMTFVKPQVTMYVAWVIVM